MLCQPHPTLGNVDGHALYAAANSFCITGLLCALISFRYGIRNIRVSASSARAVVQDCMEAEGSADARDKLFM
jgi:hypothetical protein